jgi:hypothetical protein
MMGELLNFKVLYHDLNLYGRCKDDCKNQSK